MGWPFQLAVNIYSDDSLRPCLSLEEMKKQGTFYQELIQRLSDLRENEKALVYGPYKELHLSTQTYCFERGDILIVSNNSDDMVTFELNKEGSYTGVFTSKKIQSEYSKLPISIDAHSAEIYIPDAEDRKVYEPIKVERKEVRKEEKESIPEIRIASKPYEEMSIEELQSAILAELSANGPLNDRMIKDVTDNVYRESLLNWIRSFR